MLAFAYFLTVTLMAATASASCLHGTTLHPRAVPVANFSYTGERGPLLWSKLDPENYACSTGHNQSPINIDNTIPKNSGNLAWNVPDVNEAELENLGATLEVIVNGTLVLDKKNYFLKQFHFHTPSEHRIFEEHYPLEMHLVHQAQDKSLVVIAVLFELTESGQTTGLLKSVIQNLAAVQKPGTSTSTGPLQFKELVSAVTASSLFRYSGSLTTPPCTEGVTFLVLENQLNLDVETYNSLKDVMKFNSRYTQNTLGKDNLLKLACY